MKHQPVRLHPAEMFEHLRVRAEVVERPFPNKRQGKRKTEQIVGVPAGYTLRVQNGAIRWTHLSRIRGRKGKFGWYRLHGAAEKRPARHVGESTVLVLEGASAP